MNEIMPETDVIPHSDIQNDQEEKLASLKLSMKRKHSTFTNKELEKLYQDLTKLKIRLGIVDSHSSKIKKTQNGNEEGFDRFKNFKESKEYQKLLTKLETHHKLEINLIEKRQKLIELSEQNQNLDDRKEFFEFLRDEKQYGKRREKIQTLDDKLKEDTFMAHQIYGKQTKLETFLEKQTKNVTFMNSMIKKTGLKKKESQIESPYKKFQIDHFRDRLAEIRNECEKYIDPFDLSLALRGKKSIKVLMDELNIDYFENSKKVMKSMKSLTYTSQASL